MRKTFAALAALLLMIMVAEFYFAASGAAGAGSAGYRPHHALGYVIFLLPLVMAGVGALAGLPRRLIGLAALVAGLTGVQVAVAKLARAAGDTAGPLIFGLHAVNGLAMVAVAALIARQAWVLTRPATAAVPAA